MRSACICGSMAAGGAAARSPWRSLSIVGRSAASNRVASKIGPNPAIVEISRRAGYRLGAT
jgi:hypothetical protein